MVLGKFFNPELDISEQYLPIVASELFGDNKEVALEIGFGDGDFLIDMSKIKQNWNFIGIEIKRKRYLKALRKLKTCDVDNIKLLNIDASLAIDEVFELESFSTVYINFPDPWPKDRHRKHRIINNQFLTRLSKIMKDRALLEIASDHKEYIDQILCVSKENPNFKNLVAPDHYRHSVGDRPYTKYECEYIKEGRVIYYLSLLKGKSSSKRNSIPR